MVMLSVEDEPVSDALVRSGALGAAALVSIVTDNAPEALLLLPAESVALAVTECVPVPRAEVVTVHTPPVAVPLPTAAGPSYTVTVAPDSAVPLKLGVASLVRLSVDDEPESEVLTRSGAEGAAGAVASQTNEVWAQADQLVPFLTRIRQ